MPRQNIRISIDLLASLGMIVKCEQKGGKYNRPIILTGEF